MANCLYNATMSLIILHPRFISATLVCCMIVIWRKYLFEHLHYLINKSEIIQNQLIAVERTKTFARNNHKNLLLKYLNNICKKFCKKTCNT